VSDRQKTVVAVYRHWETCRYSDCQPYRGSGLAERLVDRASARARECGCGEVTLEVDVDNDRARAFYRKLGFETYRLVQSLPVE
jgi:ribosomal protein S18 acetylase RimI-like enzyme